MQLLLLQAEPGRRPREQSTFSFHDTAKERQAQTHIPALYLGANPRSLITLDGPTWLRIALTMLANFFSTAPPQGLSAVRAECALLRKILGCSGPAPLAQRLTPAAACLACIAEIWVATPPVPDLPLAQIILASILPETPINQP